VLIRSENMLEDDKVLACGSLSNCQVYFKKTYTPVIYYFSPVMYNDKVIEIWFNPKNTMNLIQALEDDEKPFINAKVNESHVNFHDLVTYESDYCNYCRSRAQGRITD